MRDGRNPTRAEDILQFACQRVEVLRQWNTDGPESRQKCNINGRFQRHCRRLCEQTESGQTNHVRTGVNPTAEKENGVQIFMLQLKCGRTTFSSIRQFSDNLPHIN